MTLQPFTFFQERFWELKLTDYFTVLMLGNNVIWGCLIFFQNVIMEEIIPNKTKKLEKRYPPPVGLEPTTFELEVRHASPLRHGGDTSI